MLTFATSTMDSSSEHTVDEVYIASAPLLGLAELKHLISHLPHRQDKRHVRFCP